MSLSFVTKSIQTTTSDGVYEEQAVEGNETTFGSGGGTGGTGSGGTGLFDQLRHNADEEEAARLEFQRSIMRGTLALDEDDAAHLNQVQLQKQAQLQAQQQETSMQLATFRAAQAERRLKGTTTIIRDSIATEATEPEELTSPLLDDSKRLVSKEQAASAMSHVFDSEKATNTGATAIKRPALLGATLVPAVTIKRRKRSTCNMTSERNANAAAADSSLPKTIVPPGAISTASSATATRANDNNKTGTSSGTTTAGLSSLLAGYSSSDDNESTG